MTSTPSDRLADIECQCMDAALEVLARAIAQHAGGRTAALDYLTTRALAAQSVDDQRPYVVALQALQWARGGAR